MHELAVVTALVDQVGRIAREKCAHRVVSIVVRVGPLCGVEADLLERAYPLATCGTVAQGAVLVLERLPVVVRCQVCGADSEVPHNRLLCGSCGDWRTRVISGDELQLATVELERPVEHRVH
jgi:hydrogenase nickel incorporation protein HypA/HybF